MEKEIRQYSVMFNAAPDEDERKFPKKISYVGRKRNQETAMGRKECR